MRRFGATEEQIEAERAKRAQAAPPADFEVHADVWESWQFFLKVQRSWVYVGLSTGLGSQAVRVELNWPAIEAQLHMSGMQRPKWAGLWDDLLVIQDAVLAAEASANKGK